MINKNKNKILIYSLLLCSGLYLFVQCVKDDSFSRAQIEQARQAEELIAENVNHGSSGIFTLPVNLHKYNRIPQTKGAQTDTTYNIVVDSLIDHTKGRTQLFDNGWMYYQVPFKSNEIGIYAAITPKSGNFTDSLVTIKCFYLLVDNYREPQPMRYSVTMIPTHSYHKQNPDYDFLDKPSFSGYIFYSLIDGTFVRGEAYQDGVIRDVTLMPDSEKETKSESTILTKVIEKIKYCKKCRVQEAQIGKDYCWNCEPLSLQEITISAGADGGGGGGAFGTYLTPNYNNYYLIPRFNNFNGGGGGGGGPSTRTTETQHTIVCKRSGCNTGEERIKIAHGTKFQYQYPPNYSDSCSFLRAKLVSGATEYYINGNQITIGSVGQSSEFEASYGKPSKKCQEIKAMMESVPEFKSLIVRMLSSIRTNGSLEWSLYAGANTNNIGIYSGKAHSVPHRKQPFKVVIKLHSHPNGNPTLSDGDFSTLLSIISQVEYHSVERFTYGVIADNHLILVRIKNINKVRQILRNKPTIESRKKYYRDNTGLYSKEAQDKSLEENIAVMNQFLESCGLSCYAADFREVPVGYDENGSTTINFSWRDLNNRGSLLDCYNLK